MKPSSNSFTGKPDHKHPANRLAAEQSPYLLQHAHNPVQWWPFCDEAFEEAKRRDCPVFISIGYATCHWCHVMERECFEDDAVAKAMNAAFVNIKVDREERPDVDQVYMQTALLLHGHGGWPLNLALMPDRRPFFAATYIPKHSRGGRIGMMDLVPRLEKAWADQRASVLESADSLISALANMSAVPMGQVPSESVFANAEATFQRNFDSRSGGFGNAPKFPVPHNLLFLMARTRTGSTTALAMVEKSLLQMRLGGIFDQVGFGFHRYATDAAWRLPHFEKMLYDQALHILAYSEAFALTKNPDYAKTVREIVTYLLRDMQDTTGAFHSAEDADSEGEEGLFYLWTVDEIRAALPPDSADALLAAFEIRHEGNFEEEATHEKTGKNLLHRDEPLSERSAEFWEVARPRLLELRSKRPRPFKDDKILLDWNSLLIAAFARSGRCLNAPDLISQAQNLAKTVIRLFRLPNGHWLRRSRQGHTALEAQLDDLAFFAWGCLELHQADLDLNWLEHSLEATQILLEHFLDETTGTFYATSSQSKDLPHRPREFHDGAIPSGNATMLAVLHRLFRLTGDLKWDEAAERLARALAAQSRQQPTGHGMALANLVERFTAGEEILIVGAAGEADTLAFLALAQNDPNSSRLILYKNSAESTQQRLDVISPFTKSAIAQDGKATAYICRDRACGLPIQDLKLLQEAMKPPAKTDA